MFRKLLLATILCFVVMTSTAFAGDFYMDWLRSNVRADKVAIIAEVMDFTDEEAARFWAVYREYQRQLDMIVDERVKLIDYFADNYFTMTDKKASNMADKALRLEARRTNLKRKFFPRFEKAVGGIRATQFFQLERSINLLIELQISAEIPFVE
jgi:hypothetical protein